MIKMYTWGYLKEAILAKIDMTEEEAINAELVSKFPLYANEAMTQICSTVKPNRTFVEFEIFQNEQDMFNKLLGKFGYRDISEATEDDQKWYNELLEKKPYIYELQNMPEDFVSFSDDVSFKRIETVNYNKYGYPIGETEYEEIYDDSISYIGYNKVMFKQPGVYRISYNGRWFFFTNTLKNDINLGKEVPLDVLECVPSYVASQCYKISDEVKSSIFRNEYETFLARIDDTDYGQSTTIKIGGDW